MNWFSRGVLAWRLSTGMDTGFCVEALQEALDRHGSPEIFNSDPGRCSSLNAAFTGVLAASGVRIIMDSKGRYLDNIFIERLWRSLKYEDIYIKAYASVPEAPRHRRLAEVLQRRAPASGPGLSDAMRSVPGGAILWIRGQRHRVDHIPTRPSSAARKGSNWEQAL
jgi:transposase InsO family protein